MAQHEQRPEPGGKKFKFNEPYVEEMRRRRERALANPDFDPAALWQWGTVQAITVSAILKLSEKQFGREGQELVCEASYVVGLEKGLPFVEGIENLADMAQAEFSRAFAAEINRFVYASSQAPEIDSEEQGSFVIPWCAHQDMHDPIACRVQCHFVQGMIDGAREYTERLDIDMRFHPQIPDGAPACHFSRWRHENDHPKAWPDYTDFGSEKALRDAEEPRKEKESAEG